MDTANISTSDMCFGEAVHKFASCKRFPQCYTNHITWISSTSKTSVAPPATHRHPMAGIILCPAFGCTLCLDQSFMLEAVVN
jgi:hypothetical protein